MTACQAGLPATVGIVSDSSVPPTLPAPPEVASLQPDAALGRVLEVVDHIVEAGRSKTLAVERAARVGRKLPAILFGGSLAASGIAFLVIALLRGLVEVTDALFTDPKPWVAWLGFGGILLLLAVFVGTIRNSGEKRGARR